MKKPVIGLSTQQDVMVGKKISRINQPYIDAVVKAGGVPLLIPVLGDDSLAENYIDHLDGLILTGGEDMWPHYFGEEPMKEVNFISHDRDRIEWALFKKAYDSGLPIMGICRGLQLINVALGGTLYQDIFKQVPGVGGHVCGYNTEEGFHSIELEEKSILFDVFKEKTISVNSEHHQAIKDLGRGLRVTAKSADGIIEGIESVNDKFMFAVQFHPEAMAQKYDDHVELFRRFVDRCQK
jgi:putative glutamine amidotransferase